MTATEQTIEEIIRTYNRTLSVRQTIEKCKPLIEEQLQNRIKEIIVKIPVYVDSSPTYSKNKTPEEKQQQLNRIADVICKHCHVSKALFMTNRRYKELTIPRMILSHIAFYKFRINTKAIGKYLSGRDHSTVISQKRACQDMLDTDPAFTELYMNIVNDLIG